MAGYIGSKASVVSSGAEHKKVFDITTTTTSLTGLVYTPTLVHVFHNGVRLVDGTDYTATSGTTITLTVAAENGDQVVVISYATFQTSDTVSASAGGTFAGDVTMTGKLNVDEISDADNTGPVTVTDGAVVNRTGDGTIIDLQSGGTTVGSIGTDGSRIYIGTGDTGLYFWTSNNAVLPWNTTTNIERDNAIDLGNSIGRFKDLYLSGGVYLGGTGAANHLDDYEEGTWTPTLPNGGSAGVSGAFYTKVGQQVHIQAQVNFTPTNNGSQFQIGGIPFVSKAGVSTYSAGQSNHHRR
jgi:hypothetical protein